MHNLSIKRVCVCVCRGSETIEIDVGAKAGTFVSSFKSFIAFAIVTHQNQQRAKDGERAAAADVISGSYDLCSSENLA